MFNQSIIDVIKASCLIIAVIAVYYYTVFGYSRVMHVQAKRWPQIDERLFPVIDAITHFGVVYMIGLPKKPVSMLYALSMITLWTNLMKNQLNDIYELPII